MHDPEAPQRSRALQAAESAWGCRIEPLAGCGRSLHSVTRDGFRTEALIVLGRVRPEDPRGDALVGEEAMTVARRIGDQTGVPVIVLVENPGAPRWVRLGADEFVPFDYATWERRIPWARLRALGH